jgi:hypothetical protein
MLDNQTKYEAVQSIGQIQSDTELKRGSCSWHGDQLRSGPRSGELIEINISQVIPN